MTAAWNRLTVSYFSESSKMKLYCSKNFLIAKLFYKASKWVQIERVLQMVMIIYFHLEPKSIDLWCSGMQVWLFRIYSQIVVCILSKIIWQARGRSAFDWSIRAHNIQFAIWVE